MADLQQLERDFLSGKNPLAYIPLCQGLRRQKVYQKALEICQRGLAGDPDSVAGRTLFARLLNDTGRYAEALREIERVERRAPDSMGLLLEKTRCLIRLLRLDEAQEVLEGLARRNPMDPEVQNLSMRLKEAMAVRRSQTVAPPPAPAPAPPRPLKRTNAEIMAVIREGLRPMTPLMSLGVIPIRAGDPAVEGDMTHLEGAFEFFKSATRASKELEQGRMRVGLLETDRLHVIVLVRDNALVSVSFATTPEFGRILRRLTELVGQLLPGGGEE